MKNALIALCLVAAPALSQAAVFTGHCSVLRQPSESQSAKLLAYKELSLNAGDVVTIYQDGNVKYQVSLTDVSSPVIHNLQTTITYGAPNFIGIASASYNDQTVSSGGKIGVGVSLPGFPTFGCGND